MLKLRGILCPLATPFNHRGELYSSKIRHNVARLERTTLSGFVVASDWGEGPLLGCAERVRLWNEVAAAAGEGRTLLAATGVEGVAPTVALCSEAAGAGYHGVWLRPPREYGAATDARLTLLYFRSVADRSPLPVVIDASSGPGLTAEAVAELARHPNIRAACVDFTEGGNAEAALAGGGEGFAIAAGCERGLTEALRKGAAAAAVLPLANAVPFHLLSIEEAVRTRETEAAEDLEQRVTAASRAIERYGVAGLKSAMDLKGYYGGAPRLPLEAIGKAVAGEIATALDGVNS